MSKPRLLDAFSGAGGAGMGYHRAGFEVVGIDIKPQPRYPFEFIQGDAIEYIREHGHEFDVIHASPPCQRYSLMRGWNGGSHEDHPDLIAEVRAALDETGRPYVIENVVGAPLRTTVTLCGSMFGLKVRRHRLFESTVYISALRCNHAIQTDLVAVYGDHPQSSKVKPDANVRRAATIADASIAMGLDWMVWSEITQAIPPAYTEYIGTQLIAALASSKAA